MTSENVSDLSYADTLWKAADALRGQVDAAEYKHVVLGLLFLTAHRDTTQLFSPSLTSRYRSPSNPSSSLPFAITCYPSY
ncbi:MAG TPA: type I restriction-modification system subunit M N-terminal domain-containing protein [Schlesneria sp.]